MARVLNGRCFLTRRALAEGRITYRHAVEIVQALEPLDDDRAADVEALLLDAAERKTPAQLGRQARKEVAKADPDGADRRHRRARKGRRVDVVPLPDAMAELRAILPADDAARVRAAIDQVAGRTAARGDDRTIDQRRADALVALAELGALTAIGHGHCPHCGNAHGECARGSSTATSGPGSESPASEGPGSDGPGSEGPGSDGHCHGAAPSSDVVAAVLAGKRAAPPRVALTAPLSTVLGATNLPGDLTGYGPVPPSVVRALAADGKWEKWLTDNRGVVTDLGRSTYRPSAGLAALVRATYPTCVFPGCSQPSYRCDLDHNVRRIDGGPTSAANLVALCRRHHRAKDEGGWGLHHDADSGSCTWTSPAGHTYTVDPPTHDEAHEPVAAATTEAPPF
ncbi:protein of unknown function [Cryptosporangium aurantiacum]|uniref:HNH nuclease domain-containing protein n=1 Tax=Cryptosporangium aurantiacum TaxID=134849 RepID=A0A1M7KDX9_9ACTN|nr:protein of unknown function [Cryptosporangium aurantiacum]